MNFSKLKSSITSKGILQKDIAFALSLTPQRVTQIIQDEKISVKQLEIIAKMLNMHPGEFFDGDFAPTPTVEAGKLIRSLEEQITLQKEILRIKDQQISDLQEKLESKR